MFWAGEKLAKFLGAEEIVQPFIEGRIDSNAYWLSVGSECFVTSDHKRAWPDAGIQSFEHGRFGAGKTSCVIPTGQFAFLITYETIKMPSNAMGFISLRTKKAKFKGLVNISGFHVDPGYYGKIIFAVFNAGPSPIHIRQGDELFQMWLADIDVSENRTDASTKIRDGRLEVTKLDSDIVTNVSDRLVSLQDISKKIESLDRKIFQIWATGIAFAAGLAIVLNWSKILNAIP